MGPVSGLGRREVGMHIGFRRAIETSAAIVSVLVCLQPAQVTGANEASAPPALKTSWGEPDLQGIWTDETDTPLQRSPKYASQEFFTAAQRAELDRERAALLGRDRRVQRGTELDVAGAYSAVFM